MNNNTNDEKEYQEFLEFRNSCEDTKEKNEQKYIANEGLCGRSIPNLGQILKKQEVLQTKTRLSQTKPIIPTIQSPQIRHQTINSCV